MRLIFCMTLMAVSAAAQGSQAKLPNEQWVKVFNGRDLSGWIEVGHEKWTVEDGTIHGQAITREYGYLKTDKNYKDFVAAAHAAFGSIDVLVCGAGPMIVKDVETTTLDEYRAMMDGNVGSVFNCVKAALPFMRERHFGRIITFGMTGSDVTMGWRHLAAYAAAKAAVVAFTRSLALEEGQHGITCNVINVGDIRDKNADRAAALERRDYRNPLMRPGSWQDVGDAVAYLASDAASFVTGSVLSVNGGWQGFLAEFSRWP